MMNMTNVWDIMSRTALSLQTYIPKKDKRIKPFITGPQKCLEHNSVPETKCCGRFTYTCLLYLLYLT